MQTSVTSPHRGRIRMGAARGVRGQASRRAAGFSRPRTDLHDARRRAAPGAARQSQSGQGHFIALNNDPSTGRKLDPDRLQPA
jgi:hypothetical protein